MKVLHLLQSSSFSGAENVVCQIVHMMRDVPGVEMVYCSPDGPIRQALAQRGIPFEPLQALTPKQVRRAVERVKPHVIHAHDRSASLTAALVCGKTPIVSHIHNNSTQARGVSMKAMAWLYGAWRSRHIFWVCQSAMDSFFAQGAIKGKSTLLPNIIDLSALREKMQEDKNDYDCQAVYLGRLTYPKDPERLMRVLALAVRKKPDLKAAVVGSGDLEEKTKDLCVRLGLQDNVRFYGYLENPMKLLHDARVLVMTSRWEGTPMCALEALSLGVPVVSTPTDGLCQLVQPGETGFLSDCDETLAAQVAALAEDDELHGRLSRNAAARMQEAMAPEPYRAALMRVYEQCVEKDGSKWYL